MSGSAGYTFHCWNEGAIRLARQGIHLSPSHPSCQTGVLPTEGAERNREGGRGGAHPDQLAAFDDGGVDVQFREVVHNDRHPQTMVPAS